MMMTKNRHQSGDMAAFVKPNDTSRNRTKGFTGEVADDYLMARAHARGASDGSLREH